jgi:F0F1-type ATP synthase assembly protein I
LRRVGAQISSKPLRLARYASIGVEFFSPPLAGAIVGHYLDLYFKTDPTLTLVMLVLGVFAGFYRLIVMLNEFRKGS